MRRMRRSATAAGFGLAVLLVMVVCPVMAGAAPAPASASCHDSRAPGDRDGALDALTCCAAVTVSALPQPPDRAGAVSADRLAAVCLVARPAAERALAEPCTPLAPPLFVRHASLLI